MHLAATMRRVAAMVLRHTYLMRKSWIRVVEMAYWPTMNMIMWGFIAQYLATTSSVIAQIPGMFVTALLLWEVLFRGQLGFALAFLEELYARNLGHLFVSPLRPYELVISMIVVSFIRTAIGVGTAAILAYVLYATSIFNLGFSLLAFFVNLLVTGWAVGLMVAALILRYGLAAENLAWGLTFVLAPISGVYYPIETLPGWLHDVAWALPTSHVFEGMRAVLRDGMFLWDTLFHAIWLNILYMVLGIVLFLVAFRDSRNRGTLLQMGE
ncbi:MAG: ABC transporter permease [Burkholderiales bacterium]